MKQYWKQVLGLSMLLGLEVAFTAAPALAAETPQPAGVSVMQQAISRDATVVPLNQGDVTVTTYGDIKLHAFRTGALPRNNLIHFPRRP